MRVEGKILVHGAATVRSTLRFGVERGAWKLCMYNDKYITPVRDVEQLLCLVESLARSVATIAAGTQDMAAERGGTAAQTIIKITADWTLYQEKS